jgi:N-acetylglucosaminyldiphosphoundecaprenol N-acetyl-beta-D-mannosaminyltransferase
MMFLNQADLEESGNMPSSSAALAEVHPQPIMTDDLSREVYGLLGIPIDASDRNSVLKRILTAAGEGQRFLLSTANVNFLTESKRDAEFRESLLSSDLCCVDGMPIVWLARLFGIPISERVSGSDLFDTARSNCSRSEPIKVFLFGGGEGVARTLCRIINAQAGGMHCVGWLNPGFGPIAEMSASNIIQTINRSDADLLAVFLSAKKAQSWLMTNHERLRVTVRGQFGATINYQVGAVRRAPVFLQRLGFEWLWRIKEEPYLWRRYWKDGLALAGLVIACAFPIAVSLSWRRYLQKNGEQQLSLEKCEHRELAVVSLVGSATKIQITQSIAFFRTLLAEDRNIEIDISQTMAVDPRFFGLLLMLRKQLRADGKILKFRGISKRSRRIFQRNGFEFLLD